MPSPNYDALSVRLSRRLGDPAASAITDGKAYTSALRDTFINAAIVKLYKKNIFFTDLGSLRIEILDPGFFRGVLGNEGQALAANVKALSGWTGGVAWIISAKNSTTNTAIFPIRQRLKSVVETGSNTFLAASTTNQFYSIENATLKVHGSGATDTIFLQYVKPHLALSANGAADIVVPDSYWEQVLDLAEALALEEHPTQANIARAASKTAQVNKEIYG